jgi:L-alanine-DL-glutamate epimerase-like enolase superfamily enzyme
VKIVEVKAAGLRGRTPEGGWSREIRPDDCVHTVIAMLTDEGLIGWGSAFTTEDLVHGALAVLTRRSRPR